MDANTSFILLVILIIMIGLGSWYINIRFKKSQESELESGWIRFNQALSGNDVQEIIEIGIPLVRNTYLDMPQLKFIWAEVELRLKRYPELEKLKDEMIQKRINWGKYPDW